LFAEEEEEERVRDAFDDVVASGAEEGAGEEVRAGLAVFFCVEPVGGVWEKNEEGVEFLLMRSSKVFDFWWNRSENMDRDDSLSLFMDRLRCMSGRTRGGGCVSSPSEGEEVVALALALALAFALALVLALLW